MGCHKCARHGAGHASLDVPGARQIDADELYQLDVINHGSRIDREFDYQHRFG